MHGGSARGQNLSDKKGNNFFASILTSQYLIMDTFLLLLLLSQFYIATIKAHYEALQPVLLCLHTARWLRRSTSRTLCRHGTKAEISYKDGQQRTRKEREERAMAEQPVARLSFFEVGDKQKHLGTFRG